MKKSLYILLLLITGCATTSGMHQGEMIFPAPSAMDKPGYNTAFIECDSIAKSQQASVGQNALAGAALGAGFALAVGKIMGLDSGYGRLAGVGALSGGASSAASSVAHNVSNHKRIMLECMRYRGFEVY